MFEIYEKVYLYNRRTCFVSIIWCCKLDMLVAESCVSLFCIVTDSRLNQRETYAPMMTKVRENLLGILVSQRLSYYNVCLTTTSVLLQRLSYYNICLTTTSVLLQRLSYYNVCLTTTSVLLQRLSYYNADVVYKDTHVTMAVMFWLCFQTLLSNSAMSHMFSKRTVTMQMFYVQYIDKTSWNRNIINWTIRHKNQTILTIPSTVFFELISVCIQNSCVDNLHYWTLCYVGFIMPDTYYLAPTFWTHYRICNIVVS